MKKILAFILALIYLSTSIGATVHLHYCMGRLMSWGFTDHNNTNCQFCNLPNENKDKHCKAFDYGCCKDEHKQIKTGQDQKGAAFAFQFLKISLAKPLISYKDLPSAYISSTAIEYPAINAPPGINKVPVFIRNCVFLIWFPSEQMARRSTVQCISILFFTFWKKLKQIYNR